jgi:hypothetical protein
MLVSCYVNNVLWIYDEQAGLIRYNSGKLQTVPNGIFFSGLQVWALLPFSENKIQKKYLLYPERELNPHSLYGHRILSPACLPIPPSGHPSNKKEREIPNCRDRLLARFFLCGARNGTRTRDPDLGKVVLYQLSYSRMPIPLSGVLILQNLIFESDANIYQISLSPKFQNTFNTYFNPVSFFISFSLFKASMGVKRFTSKWAISSRICFSTGSSS